MNIYKKKYNNVLKQFLDKKKECQLQVYFLYLLTNYTKNKEYKLLGSHKKKICAICLQNIKKRQICIKLKCKHTYHIDCITKWKGHKKNCPECRTIIND